MAARLDRSLRRWLADALESVFGPDPGLVRLRLASRAVIGAVATIAIIVALFGASMTIAPAFAAGFMINIFGNAAVRDDGRRAKIVTLALLPLAVTASMGVTGALAGRPWIDEAVVLAICVGAALATGAGPRGLAFGLIAFIGSFIGDFLHASPAVIPEILASAAIGTAMVMALRFVILRDDTATLLDHVRRHLYRRISRIVRAVKAIIVATQDGESPAITERIESRVHRELVRLNDAFLVAQNELRDIERLPDDQAHLSWDRFFALELAAERLVRVAARHGGQARRRQCCELLDRLNAALVGGTPLPAPSGVTDGYVLRAIDALILAFDESDGHGAPAETGAIGQA